MNCKLLSYGTAAFRTGAIALITIAALTSSWAQDAPAPAATTSVAPPATTLAKPSGFPGSSFLPPQPEDTRLPGPDPRQCGSSRWSALCAEGRWAKFSRMQVEMKAPDFVGMYSMEQPSNNDVHTTYSETAGKRRRGGEVLFINEEAFAFRSRDVFASPTAMLDDMMSSPILVTQLAALLLDQGALVSPEEITKPTTFSARNSKQYLRTEAPGTAALFGPPWEVTGSVRPNDDGSLAFRMRLSHRPVDIRGRLRPGRRDTVELQGTVSYGDRREAMSPTFDLIGWKLMFRGVEMPPVHSLEEARTAVGGR